MPGDVGRQAKDLGWSGGYGARFSNSVTDDPNATVITQSIAIYPENTMR